MKMNKKNVFKKAFVKHFATYFILPSTHRDNASIASAQTFIDTFLKNKEIYNFQKQLIY